MGDEVAANGAWARPKNLANSANKPPGPTTAGSIYNTKDWPTLGEAVNCVDNAKINNNWDNINSRRQALHNSSAAAVVAAAESNVYNGKSALSSSSCTNSNAAAAASTNTNNSGSSNTSSASSNNVASGATNSNLNTSNNATSIIKKTKENLNCCTVNISKNMSEFVICEETNSFSKLLITKEPLNCCNTATTTNSTTSAQDSASSTSGTADCGAENGGAEDSSTRKKAHSRTSTSDMAKDASNNSNCDADEDSTKENRVSGQSHHGDADAVSGGKSGEEVPGAAAASTTTANTITKGKKKGSKNKWKPLDIEPSVMLSKMDDRRKGGQRIPKKKDSPPSSNTNVCSNVSGNMNSSASGHQENGSLKKYQTSGPDGAGHTLRNGNSSETTVPNVGRDGSGGKGGFRGSSRRGRGGGRGGGGRGGGMPGMNGPYRGRQRGFDGSGRVTPNAPIHDDYPADIAYYVDFTPITDPNTAEAELGNGVMSPSLAPAGPTFLPASVIPTSTAFLSPYFAPFPPTPAVDPETLKKCIKTQVEYYFSEENLQRDFFLRRKMDKEGYLPIQLIASFHRVATLTNNIETIIDALQTSDKIEFDKNRTNQVRTKDDPLKWPIPDEGVKNSSAAAFAAPANTTTTATTTITSIKTSNTAGDTLPASSSAGSTNVNTTTAAGNTNAASAANTGAATTSTTTTANTNTATSTATMSTPNAPIVMTTAAQ